MGGYKQRSRRYNATPVAKSVKVIAHARRLSACTMAMATKTQNATEGTIKELTYWWPRPGTEKPLEKVTFYTRVGDQDCGVGYYKE